MDAMNPRVFTEIVAETAERLTWSCPQQPDNRAWKSQHATTSSACTGAQLTSSDQWEQNKNLLASAVMMMMTGPPPGLDHKVIAEDAATSYQSTTLNSLPVLDAESDQSSEPEGEPHNIIHSGELSGLQPDPADVPHSVLAEAISGEQVSFVQADACDRPGRPEGKSLDDFERREKKKELRRRRRKASSLVTLAWKAQQEQQVVVPTHTSPTIDQVPSFVGAGSITEITERRQQCKEQICTRCGSEIMTHFKFCRFCGAPSPSC